MKQPNRLTRKEKIAMAEITDVPLSFDSPDSASVVRASYDPRTAQLTVELKRTRGITATYIYDSYPSKEWIDFEAAPSKGKFFAGRIRPLYSGRQI